MVQIPNAAITLMSQPVWCRWCREVYDLDMVTVAARYADCSMWRTPCCNQLADSREWKSLPDFTRLTPAQQRAAGQGFVYIENGVVWA